MHHRMDYEPFIRTNFHGENTSYVVYIRVICGIDLVTYQADFRGPQPFLVHLVEGQQPNYGVKLISAFRITLW